MAGMGLVCLVVLIGAIGLTKATYGVRGRVGGPSPWHNFRPGASQRSHWKLLTLSNFEHQIQSHPFVLCLATVPWCGESISLMNQVVKLLEDDAELLKLLQLRLLYTNIEQELSITLPVRKTPTFLFFRNGIAYKYNGKLNSRNILSGVRHGITVPSNDLPFKVLTTNLELDSFLSSTDKAIVLFDFCRWAEKASHKLKQIKPGAIGEFNISVAEGSNDSRDGMEICLGQDKALDSGSSCRRDQQDSKGSVLIAPRVMENLEEENIGSTKTSTREAISGNFSKQDDNGLNHERKVESMGMELSSKVCDVETSWNWNLGLQMYSSIPARLNISRAGNRTSIYNEQQLCSATSYKKFKRMYKNLTYISRTSFLTPERARFGILNDPVLVLNRGFNFDKNVSWLIMMHVIDRPNVPEFYHGVHGLEDFLSTSPYLVSELEGEKNIDLPPLSNVTPSVILFIDRASPSDAVREGSLKALQSLREVARLCENLNREEFEGFKNSLLNSERKESVAQIMQSGSHIEDKSHVKKTMDETPLHKDLLVSSVNSVENIEVILPTRKEFSHSEDDASELPKHHLNQDNAPPEEVSEHAEGNSHGFVLKSFEQRGLSLLNNENSDHVFDESDIKSNTLSLKVGKDISDFLKDIIEVHVGGSKKETLVSEITSDKLYALSDNSGHFENKVLRISIKTGSEFEVKADDFNKLGSETNKELSNDERTSKKSKASVLRPSDIQFFFVDGDEQIQERLSQTKSTPSLVILDPKQQEHYVLSTGKIIDQSSILKFLKQFYEGMLPRSFRSEKSQMVPRQGIQPPFVNYDFHELDSVPRITGNILLREFVRFNADRNSSRAHLFRGSHSGDDHLWAANQNDVLVLFTTPWCGFCRRTELVFREFYRSLKGYSESSALQNEVAKKLNVKQGMSASVTDFRGVESLEGMHKVSGNENNLPLLFQIDCSVNECNHVLKDLSEEEAYPQIILFPFDEKRTHIQFNGGLTVQALNNFLCRHGTFPMLLQRGGMESSGGRLRPNLCTRSASFPHGVKIGKGSSGKQTNMYEFKVESRVSPPHGLENTKGVMESFRAFPYPSVGSVLVATEKLSKASSVFDNSIILIVKADGVEGFGGLIVNKPLSWKNLPGLDAKLVDPLVDSSTPLHYGGPVVLQGKPFLCLTRNGTRKKDGFTEVVSGVYFGDPDMSMSVFRAMDGTDIWFFLGHALWGWQQLLDELDSQLWTLNDFSEDLIRWPSTTKTNQ